MIQIHRNATLCNNKLNQLLYFHAFVTYLSSIMFKDYDQNILFCSNPNDPRRGLILFLSFSHHGVIENKWLVILCK